jgi:hypothetical protein
MGVREAMFDERLHPHDRRGRWKHTFPHPSDIPGRHQALMGGPYAGPPGTETVGGVTYFADKWHADSVAAGMPRSVVVRRNAVGGRVGGWVIRRDGAYHDATVKRPFVQGDTWADSYGDLTPANGDLSGQWKQSMQREKVVERHLRIVRSEHEPSDGEKKRRAAIARGYTTGAPGTGETRLVAAAVEDEMVEGLFGRGRKLAGDAKGAYAEADHPRGRGGEWIAAHGVGVQPSAGHEQPLGPEKPKFSENKALLGKIADNYRKAAPGMDKALLDTFDSGDIELRDLRRMRARAQALLDESKGKRGTDPVARERHDLASLILQHIRAVEVRTFGRKLHTKGSRDYVDEYLKSTPPVHRSIFDPTGAHSYGTA